MIHKPVLVKEVLENLNPKENENFIDGTVGEGGHANEILKRIGPLGKLLGMDLDNSQIERSKVNLVDFKERIILENYSYANVKEVVKRINFNPVNGILLDVGFSSWHLESKKGFTFQEDECLDMRYSEKNDLTARKIVNEYSENEIERILREFGEEIFSKQIARKILEKRKFKKIENTFELKNIIQEAISSKFKYSKIHPATRTFQALRIAVNEELDNLTKFLPDAFDLLEKGGRIAVISFHSLEDRIVKNFFREKEKLNQIKILNKKPIVASSEEVIENPRSRSAKLRAAMKISE